MGLRGRLLLLLLVPMILVIGGYGFVRTQVEERALLDEERRRMAVTAKALQVAVENARRDRQISDIKRLIAEVVLFQAEIDRIRIFDTALRSILVSNPLTIGEETPTAGLSQAMEERQPIHLFRRQGGQRALFTLVPLRDRRGAVWGAMEIVQLAGTIDAKLEAARLEVMLRVGMLTVVLGVLVWVGVRQSVLLPIRRLIGGVRALAAGQPEPIPVSGHNEIGQLAREFNDMAERLAETHRKLVTETEARLDLARQVRQTEQLVVAGRIASEVAHEIGTPLNIISGRAEYLLRELPPDSRGAAQLRTIVTQTDRITGIMSSLLDVVRPQKAEIQPVRISPLFDSIVELLRPTARKGNLAVAIDLPRDAQVLADPSQLRQVVTNLLVNAIEATSAGGQITLRARPAPRADGQPGITIEVADTGSGIRREDLSRVFDPFFTTKPPGHGTGLGLAICRDIVREHGGTIEVDSALGVGTTIRVRLPASSESLP